MTTTPEWLPAQQTPFLLIDEARLQRNIDRLQQRITNLGSQLRPHLKTLRAVKSAEYLLPYHDAPATVSTMAEAEAFAGAGYTNLLYAVGIAKNKLPRVAALINSGVNLHILLDSQAQAECVVEYSKQHGVPFSVFIEIDCDDHRGGLAPDNEHILTIAQYLQENGVTVTGLMTHAGGSYDAHNIDEIKQAARAECEAVITVAKRLRGHGIICPILSVGSTPTAHYAEDLSGISEVRAGVYTTFDLVMLNLGVCNLDDIAMAVVTTVIGHNQDKNWLLVDAGWMALSRDRGTAGQKQDYGYGLVCDHQGNAIPNVCVTSVNQEHGVIALPDGYSVADFPIDSQLRVLPNHACATAAMHQEYVVLKQNGERSIWPRILGW